MPIPRETRRLVTRRTAVSRSWRRRARRARPGGVRTPAGGPHQHRSADDHGHPALGQTLTAAPGT